MKTKYFVNLLATMLLLLLTTTVKATQFKLSEGDTDADLAAILDQAQDGDEIVLDGYVYFSAPVTVNKNVTFVGASGDPIMDGFDGGDATMLFNLAPDPIDGAKLIFKDLGFFGGYNNSPTDVGDAGTSNGGGVGRITGGTTEFYNCEMDENHADNKGGLFVITSSSAVGDPATNVKFSQCVMEGNYSQLTGGAFCTYDDNTNVSFEFCKITYNKTYLDRGGAFYLNGKGTYNFYYCLIAGNTSGIEGAGGERGGAGITTAGNLALTMESCAVVSNIAYGNHGSAFFLMGSPNITLINSVVANNVTKEGAGSWFIANDATGVDITFVNTIMTQNHGGNSGNAGGGIRVMNTDNRINFFNSIVIGNDTDNGEGPVDLGSNDKPGIESTWVFKNSIVGLIYGVAGSRLNQPEDLAGINPSIINMYGADGATNPIDWTTMDVSGVDFIDQPLSTPDFGMPYYTLTDKSAYAAGMGNPELLADYDRSTDMFDVERTVSAAGAIFAGPVQSVTGKGIAKDPIPTAIKQVTLSPVQENIRVIGVSNGILGVDFGELKGLAKGTLLNVAGQEVEKVFNVNVVDKGYYNIHVAPGVYILKVELGGKTYAQKLVVTQ